MASLTRRPDSAFWIACFTAHDGRQLKRSTKVPITDGTTKPADLKRDALRIATEFEIAARVARTMKQTRDVISDLHERITGDAITQRTTSEAAKSWLERKKPEVGRATHDFYTHSMGKFLEFMGTAAERDLSAITRDLITRYRNSINLSPTSINHHLGVVKQFVTDCRREGILSDNPAEFVDKVKRRKSETPRRPFTQGELAAVLEACSPEWRSAVMFGIYTGQRLGDILTMRWSSVQDGVLRFRSGKTGRQMQVPIAAPLARHLANLPRDPIFIHPGLAKLKSSTRSNQFAAILAKAGIRKAQPHRASSGNGRAAERAQNELSFHCLRHTTVTLLKEAGVPAAIVMEIVGHDSTEVSQAYTHIGHEAAAAGMAKMPDITNAPI